MRTLAQSGVLPTVLRLSDENETQINLAKPVRGRRGVGWRLPDGHRLRGNPGGRSTRKRAAVTALLSGLGGTSLGEDEGWSSGRFHGPYLRDSLLDVGVLVETLETVTFWSNLQRVYDAVKAALTAALGDGTLVLCHISHVYETGASLYFTVATKQADDPVAQWLAAKAAASDAMIDNGASITHHHAVGQDHKPWLAREIGPVGVRMLRALKAGARPDRCAQPRRAHPLSRTDQKPTRRCGCRSSAVTGRPLSSTRRAASPSSSSRSPSITLPRATKTCSLAGVRAGRVVAPRRASATWSVVPAAARGTTPPLAGHRRPARHSCVHVGAR